MKVLLQLFLACSLASGTSCIAVFDRSPEPEAHSLLDAELHRPALDEDRAGKLEADLEAARISFEAEPGSEERAIWVGRRLAYLSRYRDAIDWYTERLEEHPESFRLLRHRGHRYISVRDFDRAVADLERAAALIQGVPDETEPDGMPNDRGIPRSTNHSNIYYHLGLARYLQGDLEAALDTYRKCMEFSRVNDDMLVATSHWLYMTLRRLGRAEEARSVLEPVHAGMDVIENFGYRDLLLMYKGERDPEELTASVEEGSVESATVAYGVGNWWLYNGQPERARAIFESIVAGGAWAAFGHIAAEAELARDRG